jgi:hypothetical protein
LLSLLGLGRFPNYFERGIALQGSIFTVLIALGLMQPIDGRREIDSQYVNDLAGAKSKLADAFLKRSNPLAVALGETELDTAEKLLDAQSLNASAPSGGVSVHGKS